MAILLKGKQTDLDGFSVNRILPHPKKRMVGPFIFLDHMGPAIFEPGDGIDVRPHPHVGLATITYMLEGSLLHRDSLGNNIEILPGDVNWMTTGRGIVHSERETFEVKSQRHVLNGMQAWLALPKESAEIQPSFSHTKRCQLPHHIFDSVQARLIAGDAYGMTSPIKSYSPMFYLDVIAKQGKRFERPNSHQECAVYVVEGTIQIEGESFTHGDFVLLETETSILSVTNSRCLLYGGDAWPTIPYIDWNFVSFDKSRIEKAKQDWRERRFPDVPGDDAEFTPLPGE